MSRHKHADAIIAWAEGHDIEYRLNGGAWAPCKEAPHWFDDVEYRVKRAPREWWIVWPHGIIWDCHPGNAASDKDRVVHVREVLP